MKPARNVNADALIRTLFGADVFISYARADGFHFAAALAARLAARGLSVAIDQAGSAPGRTVPRATLASARRASLLVVVSTAAATRSQGVGAEVRAFPVTVRAVVPVEFPEVTDPGSEWSAHLEGVARSIEPVGALADCRPSDALVDRVVHGVGVWRQGRRIRTAALASVCLLALSAIGAALLLQSLDGTIERLNDTQDQLATNLAALGQANDRLETIGGELHTMEQQRQEKEVQLDEATLRLAELSRKTAEQEAHLAATTARARREKQRADDQASATAEVWDTLQIGLQAAYVQPDLTCPDHTLKLDPPLSIYFESDKSEITPEAADLLDRFVACYRTLANPPRLEIQGHISRDHRLGGGEGDVTDYIAHSSTDYGLALAQHHAMAVESYLMSAGLLSNQMVTATFGQERPVHPVVLMNNRVEIRMR